MPNDPFGVLLKAVQATDGRPSTIAIIEEEDLAEREMIDYSGSQLNSIRSGGDIDDRSRNFFEVSSALCYGPVAM